MANLLHENKKMTVFETLDVCEALESKYSFVAGESVSTANVIIFLPKNDGKTPTKMMEMMLIVFRTTFAEGNFHQMLNRICKEQEAQN